MGIRIMREYRQTGRDKDGDNIVGMDTKYFTVSPSIRLLYSLLLRSSQHKNPVCRSFTCCVQLSTLLYMSDRAVAVSRCVFF